MTFKPEKLYKIGEIMNYTGLSRQTLHNYTVAGLIEEAKRTPSGHRLYSESVFQDLSTIKDLQAKNLTLIEIKKIFEKERQSLEEISKQQLSIDFDLNASKTKDGTE